MSRLAVNQFGQIYATDPDREDGGGYGYTPECVSQQDVTLGSAYLKAQGVRQGDLLKLRRDQQFLDQEEAAQRRIANHNRTIAEKRDMAQARMLENPAMKAAVLKKALGEGCDCEYRTPMSGNVMSANGQFGILGMTPDQQTIHSVAMGRNSGVHRVDPNEARQAAERAAAQKIMRLRARR
jgi:hypothetical protein